MRCAKGISTGGTDMIPEQQLKDPSRRCTNGEFREARIVFGT